MRGRSRAAGSWLAGERVPSAEAGSEAKSSDCPQALSRGVRVLQLRGCAPGERQPWGVLERGRRKPSSRSPQLT